nr:MAG TPA: hypothetical protein [Caudoviricetes sp.]
MKIKNKDKIIIPFEALQSGDCFLDMVLEVVIMKVSTVVQSIDGVEIANAVILKTGELMFYDKDEMVIALPEAEIMY